MSCSLPGEVVSYLRSHRTFDIDTSPSECGDVVLASADALAVRDFWVNGEGRDWPDDPHADDGGYYVVPGVDLVGAVEGFDPDGILVWVPELSSFGTWDSDHWDLIVFEATPWEAIVADPVPFLDAQWDPTCPFDYLRPWTLGFEWRDGRPF